jgi:PAS domain S-box-containing protein
MRPEVILKTSAVRACKTSTRLAGVAAAAVGCMGLLGWVLDAEVLKAVFIGGVTIKANASVCLVLLGTALLLLSDDRRSRWRAVAARLLAGAAAAVGGPTLFEHLSGYDLGIDQLLFREPPGAAATVSPGRMGPPASASFLLSGLALLLLDVRTRRGRAPSQWLALLVGLIALLPLIGYAYRIQSLYGVAVGFSKYTGIALHTAVAILALAIGLLAARPTEGLMATVVAEDAGGMMARRLLLPAILIPFALGWLRTVGQRAGLFDESFGRPILISSLIVSFTALVWWNARALSALGRDRLRAEEELGRSQRQLASVIDNAPSAVFIKDTSGRYLLVNAPFERMAGVPVGSMTGKTDADLFPPEVAAQFRGEDERVARSLEPMTFEESFDFRGRHHTFVTNKFPLRDEAGGVYAVCGIATDVTTLKQAEASVRESEQRLSAILNNTPAMVYVVDAEGRFEFVNGRWGPVFGLTNDRVSGRSVYDLLPKDVADQFAANNRRVLESRSPVEAEEVVPHADGPHTYISVKVPLFDASGAPHAVCGISTDITDRKAAEGERERLLESERAARAEAERAGRMKDEFLANLSHELRTPLNAILGWSQILRTGRLDGEDSRQGLEAIERNARAQTRIIEDLLELSRIISGKVRLDVQRLDLSGVVAAAIDTVRPAAEAKGVRVHSALDPDAGPVSGDPNRLQQVFWNLLSNAVKFTPRGGRVQVLLERVSSHVEVGVIDTGEGIAPEFLPHVFGRFRQADGSTTRRHGGLGIGLSIVRQLVELHGGSVRVQSGGPGAGATFTVALPLTAVHPAAQEVRQHPAPNGEPRAAVPESVTLKGVRVLVVDDEPDARDLLHRLLTDREAEVVAAASAGEAMEIISRGPPTVLLTDIGMPDEDGYALIRRVRALPAANGGGIPAIALTAYAGSDDRTRAMLAGFQVHLSKPVEPGELVATVASLAGLTRLP